MVDFLNDVMQGTGIRSPITSELAGFSTELQQLEGIALGMLGRKRRKKKNKRRKKVRNLRIAVKPMVRRRGLRSLIMPGVSSATFSRRSAPRALPAATPTPRMLDIAESAADFAPIDEAPTVDDFPIDEAPPVDDFPIDEAPIENAPAFDISADAEGGDEAMMGQLGFFKKLKKIIRRNKNTLRSVAGVVPGAGGVIANALLPQQRAAAGPAARSAAPVRRVPAPKQAFKVTPAMLAIGGGALLVLFLASRRGGRGS